MFFAPFMKNKQYKKTGCTSELSVNYAAKSLTILDGFSAISNEISQIFGQC